MRQQAHGRLHCGRARSESIRNGSLSSALAGARVLWTSALVSLAASAAAELQSRAAEKLPLKEGLQGSQCADH